MPWLPHQCLENKAQRLTNLSFRDCLFWGPDIRKHVKSACMSTENPSPKRRCFMLGIAASACAAHPDADFLCMSLRPS